MVNLFTHARVNNSFADNNFKLEQNKIREYAITFKVFDKEFILNYLTQNGFNEAKEREFDPLLDWPNRHYESLYCIGYK